MLVGGVKPWELRKTGIASGKMMKFGDPSRQAVVLSFCAEEEFGDISEALGQFVREETIVMPAAWSPSFNRASASAGRK